jgi:hypothetical protein
MFDVAVDIAGSGAAAHSDARPWWRQNSQSSPIVMMQLALAGA